MNIVLSNYGWVLIALSNEIEMRIMRLITELKVWLIKSYFGIHYMLMNYYIYCIFDIWCVKLVFRQVPFFTMNAPTFLPGMHPLTYSEAIRPLPTLTYLLCIVHYNSYHICTNSRLHEKWPNTPETKVW